MTLIASFKWRQTYFAFGDTLVTTPKKTYEDTPIPTRDLPNETEQLDGSGLWVAGLARKVFTIGPHIVFGWSGPMANFEHALRYLYASGLYDHRSLPELQNILSEAGLPRDQDSAWFIDAFTSDRGLVEFSHNMKRVAQEESGGILVAGSGARTFREMLNLDSAAETDGLTFFKRTIAAQARFLLGQQRQGRHLDHAFGGAFEFIGSENGSFVNLDRVLIVFRDYWDVGEQNDVRKDVDNVSLVGNTFSKIDAAYYVSHIDDTLVVDRWFPGSHKMFAAPRPFDDQLPSLGETSWCGVDQVLEVLTHYTGNRSSVFDRIPDEYDFEVIGEAPRVTFPMSLPVDLESALREHISQEA
ncbi:hypothetical protein [Rhizobium leguminosarum]|uniref:Uncharacterized protein n=1 Tax=Rhizobium leguminosarum TaxID=384 RepID=A0A7X0DVC9_RHILE|nr:hypothetical protein [Rhizobium leguminosarum]MBB6224545.1 hypothetical protein [Rhizobium leguminosarum]